KPQSGTCFKSLTGPGRIFVLERSFLVGSVPSTQMYSALIAMLLSPRRQPAALYSMLARGEAPRRRPWIRRNFAPIRVSGRVAPPGTPCILADHGNGANFFSALQQLSQRAAVREQLLRLQRLHLQSQTHRPDLLLDALLRGARADRPPPRGLGGGD